MASFSNFDAPFRVQSQLFQPPRTPSSSSSFYPSPEYSGTRKRLRREAPDERPPLCDPVSSVELESPAPLVNTDYILANGGEDQQRLDLKETKEILVEELDYRPNRYRENNVRPATPNQTAENKDVENRKRSRSDATETAMPYTPSVSSGTPGWGRTMFTVVGKVWDFCWTSAFRGFSAGGGQGYTVTSQSSLQPMTADTTTWQMVHHQDQPSASKSRSKSASTPIPGQYPEDEVDAEQVRDRETWVLVPESPSTRISPSRSESPTHFARKVPRRSSAYRPQPRRSIGGLPRAMNKRPTLNPSRPSNGLSLSSAARPSTPTKPPVSPTRTSNQNSPASRDAQRFAAKFRRREREEDASFQKMNDQLKALIREGREALGSRVEVDEMDLDDEQSGNP
ncbi:hypothetical protein BGW36DRAFT_54830 [Talaromyces proteolyticus]|uniref:Uncharacterized protein n=1 Tax=Talaromyces proteolyticus TaxID=1131652 RepID=A0AAD4KI30_9EURO|nr:uncharacterized protein BGW36DRAFT_54830 [Talaromyces proteolyticus]KAH8691594.1 hypothetical protein BGW36DRAFT_54830 [Talaromyces proteolyticus]